MWNTLKREDAHETLLAEHERIIETIEKRDKEEAMKAVSRHIDNQVAAVIDTIRTKKIEYLYNLRKICENSDYQTGGTYL